MIMSNFSSMVAMIDAYLLSYGIEQNIKSSLHETSKNKCDNCTDVVYAYNGMELEVIDMDSIAKNGYKKIKKPSFPLDKPINTVDAFLINSQNQWFFVEFKDAPINDTKNKITIFKKAYANWYMLMEILYKMKNTENEYSGFDFSNPIEFAQNNVYYIAVFTTTKNPQLYMQIKNQDLVKSTYTPPFMEKVKTYIFKDAFVYTESFFERKFVRNFSY